MGGSQGFSAHQPGPSAGIWFPHWASKGVKGPTAEGAGPLATSLPLVQWRERGSGQCGSLPQLTELVRGRANIQTQACLSPKLWSFHGTTSAHTREESWLRCRAHPPPQPHPLLAPGCFFCQGSCLLALKWPSPAWYLWALEG